MSKNNRPNIITEESASITDLLARFKSPKSFPVLLSPVSSSSSASVATVATIDRRNTEIQFENLQKIEEDNNGVQFKVNSVTSMEDYFRPKFIPISHVTISQLKDICFAWKRKMQPNRTRKSLSRRLSEVSSNPYDSDQDYDLESIHWSVILDRETFNLVDVLKDVSSLFQSIISCGNDNDKSVLEVYDHFYSYRFNAVGAATLTGSDIKDHLDGFCRQNRLKSSSVLSFSSFPSLDHTGVPKYLILCDESYLKRLDLSTGELRTFQKEFPISPIFYFEARLFDRIYSMLVTLEGVFVLELSKFMSNFDTNMTSSTVNKNVSWKFVSGTKKLQISQMIQVKSDLFINSLHCFTASTRKVGLLIFKFCGDDFCAEYIEINIEFPSISMPSFPTLKSKEDNIVDASSSKRVLDEDIHNIIINDGIKFLCIIVP